MIDKGDNMENNLEKIIGDNIMVYSGADMPYESDIGEQIIAEIIHDSDYNKVPSICSGKLCAFDTYNERTSSWFKEYYIDVKNGNTSIFFNPRGQIQGEYNGWRLVAWAVIPELKRMDGAK
jgi:hypothetical protein